MQPIPASFGYQLSHWEFHRTSKRCRVQLWEVVFCLMISPYLNRFADDQELSQFEGVNKRLKWKEQNCSKAENSLQFQELPYIRNMTTRATFCGKVLQWQPARHVVWSPAEITNSRCKEISWGCMSDNANQQCHMSSVASSNLVWALGIEVEFCRITIAWCVAMIWCAELSNRSLTLR